MKVIPTRRFVLLLLLGLIFPVLGAISPGIELLAVIYSLVLFGLLWVSKRLVGSPSKILVRRNLDVALSVRAKNLVQIEVENKTRKALKGFLRDDPPESMLHEQNEWKLDLPPGRTAVFEYHVKPTSRGLVTFLPIIIRLKAPLGLCFVDIHTATEQQISVFPNLKAVQDFELLRRKGKLATLGVRRTRLRGIGTEFESLREYQPDDDYRRIDWKGSAKKGNLIVRDYEIERNQPVFVVIDIGRLMMAEAAGTTKLDHVLDAALLFLHAAEVAGDQVGLMIYGSKVVRYVPPKRGRQHLKLLINTIHNLDAEPLETDHRAGLSYFAQSWTRRALVVLFTDSETPADAERLMNAMRPLKHRHLWFIAKIRDPLLGELDSKPLKTNDDFFTKAALLQYLDSRNKAETRIRMEYRYLMDCEPQELASRLVNAYIEVKEKGAIG